MLTYILNYRWLFRPLWIATIIFAVIWAFASQPLAFALNLFTISLVVLVPAVLWKTDPSRWTVIVCLAFTVSYFATTFYQYAPIFVEPPTEPVEMMFKDRSTGAEHVLAVIPPDLAHKVQVLGLAKNLYLLAALLVLSGYAGLLVAKLWRIDPQATACMIVLAVAELFEPTQFSVCRLNVDPLGTGDIALASEWGERVAKQACGRLFGWWTPYVPTIICSLYIVGIITMRKFKRS